MSELPLWLVSWASFLGSGWLWEECSISLDYIFYFHIVGILKWIEKGIDRLGRYTSWLNLSLVLLICLDVALRYLFSYSKNWILELEWHLFAVIFLLGASYGLQHDKHVRVDIFYQNMSEKAQAWLNLLGTLIFLLPWCYVVVKTSAGFAHTSWIIGEGSANPGGLPARYIIRSVVPLAFVLLAVQGLVIALRQMAIIKNSK